MGRAIAGFGLSVLLTIGLLEWDVFGAAGRALASACGAGTEAAKVERTFLDPVSQDVSTGERVRESLRRLSAETEGQGAGRTVLIGNSQTFSVVLAPQESVPGNAPKTYPDLVRDRLMARGGGDLYRLSAPNLSYLEALWEVSYLAQVKELKPRRVVLQLNYESFRKTGIREGMLELLNEPRFAEAIRRLIGENGRYSSAFEQAVKRHEERKDGAGRKLERGRASLGAEMETGFRAWAGEQTIWEKKHETKAQFLNLLYLLRVYLLKITPTTPRPLSGAAYETSVAALDRLATVCSDNGIELRLFLAPQNPTVRMWLTQADRDRYRGACSRLAEKRGLKLVDLEDCVPDRLWGVWIDGPDPIHFGLEGHRVMAESVLAAGLMA